MKKNFFLINKYSNIHSSSGKKEGKEKKKERGKRKKPVFHVQIAYQLVFNEQFILLSW